MNEMNKVTYLDGEEKIEAIEIDDRFVCPTTGADWNDELKLNIVSTTIYMRGVVNNFSDPISSTLAKLYECLLVQIHENIHIEMIDDIRTLIKDDYENSKIGYFDMIEKADNINNLDEEEDFIEKFQRMLFDIQTKSMDCMKIYAELSNITKLDIDILSEFCKRMADIELEFILSDIDYGERFIRQNELVELTTQQAKDDLAKWGISIENFNFLDASEFLKTGKVPEIPYDYYGCELDSCFLGE